MDERLRFFNHLGETIQLHDLLKRWNAKKFGIEELCFAGWLIPHHELGCGASYEIDGKRALVFCPLPSETIVVITDVDASNTFYSLPDDVFFYMTEIMAFEEKHPELAVYDGSRDKEQSLPSIPDAKEGNLPKPTRDALSKPPKRRNAWFEAINDMTTDFYNEFGKIPKQSQAWGRLCTQPPHGYEITTGKDKGEECLNMPGEKTLSRSAFNKRWSSYTANKGK